MSKYPCHIKLMGIIAFCLLFLTGSASSLSGNLSAQTGGNEGVNQMTLAPKAKAALAKINMPIESVINSMHFSKSSQSESNEHENTPIHMSLTIELIGNTVYPLGYNLDATPFVISPQGKKYEGVKTNILFSEAITSNGTAVIPLNEIVVPNQVEGTYAMGCDLSLGEGSTLVVDREAIFSIVVTDFVISGIRGETVNSQRLTMPLSRLGAYLDFLMVAGNAELKPLPHCRRNHHSFHEDVTIEITVEYLSLIRSTIPLASTFTFTPFAKAPNGKIYRGIPSELTLDPRFSQSALLNPVTIHKPVKGNYFVGYEITATSPGLLSAATYYLFSGQYHGQYIDDKTEWSAIPDQDLPLGALQTSSDIFKVTGNFEITEF